jgi:hypothetical protein
VNETSAGLVSQKKQVIGFWLATEAKQRNASNLEVPIPSRSASRFVAAHRCRLLVTDDLSSSPRSVYRRFRRRAGDVFKGKAPRCLHVAISTGEPRAARCGAATHELGGPPVAFGGTELACARLGRAWPGRLSYSVGRPTLTRSAAGCARNFGRTPMSSQGCRSLHLARAKTCELAPKHAP